MITLIFGDSIAWGAFDSRSGGWASLLQKDGFKHEDFVYNLSISGDTSLGILNRMNDEISARIDDDDLRIIFAFGINDAARIKDRMRSTPPMVFDMTVKEIIKQAQKYTKDITFLSITPIDEFHTKPVAWNKHWFYYNSDINEYNKILYGAVEKHKGVNLINIHRVLRDDSTHLKDGVHPNAVGHRRIYDVIKRSLKEG